MDLNKELPSFKQLTINHSDLKAVLLILFIAIGVYFPTMWYGFSPMDDKWVIKDYKTEMSVISNLPHLFKTATFGMYYRPIWASSIMLDFIAGEGSAFPFHLTNILLHGLCCLLIYKVFRVLDIEKWLCVCCAIIFAVHPLNVHAVTWIPGRNDTLLCLFTLVSLFYLLSHLKKNNFILLSMHYVGFCFALLTKENAIVLPVLFGLIWFLVSNKNIKSPFFILFISWALIASVWFLIRKSVVDFFPSSGVNHISETILNFLSAIVIYIGKCVLPIQQSILPLVQNTSLIPGLFIIITIIFLAIKFGFKDKRIATLGLIWFFIFIIIPVWVGATNTNSEHYEHRAYTSLIGFILMVSQINIRSKKKMLAILFAVITSIYLIKTIYRYQVYKNELTFATAAIAESPSVAMLQNIAGLEYVKIKEFNRAIPYFTKAIELKPDKGEYYNNRGGCYSNLKDFSHALEDFNKAVELMPGNGKAYLNRSMMHFSLGHITPAVNDLEQAYKLKTGDIPKGYYDQLNIAFQNEIISTYTVKIDQNPAEAINYNIRGVAYFNLKNLSKALIDYNKAIELDPKNVEFLYNRFVLYSQVNDRVNAMLDQQQLIKLGFKGKKSN